MINLKRIIPECCADTFLVSRLFQQEMIADYNGIGDVANALKQFPTDDYIIGLIDTDKFKRDPNYIKQFSEIVEDKLVDEGLLVNKLPGTNKHIIRLHPAFEKWILSVAAKCNVDAAKFGFDTLDRLCKATKKIDVVHNDKVQIFLDEIIQKDPPGIQTLRYWLSKAID